MKLDVPYSWEGKLLDMVEDNKPNISEFYGSITQSICGHGRHPDSVPKIEKKEVAQHIQSIHDFGASFNYIMNSICLGNKEYTKKKELFEYLSWINKVGADYITVSNPFILEFISQYFPQFKVKLSLGANADSLQQSQIYQRKGFSMLSSQDIGRKFDILKEMIKNGTVIELVANNTCLLDCPIMNYHSCFCGHNSQMDGPQTNRFDDFPVLWCSLAKMDNLVEFLKSAWIRPEDIRKYEDIGVERFKISGREKNSEWIAQRVQIYSKRKHDGNCLDFLSPSLYGYPKFTPEIFIDNQQLDGFLDFFIEGKCDGKCSKCNHCHTYYEKAVKIKGDISKYKHFLNMSKEKICSLNAISNNHPK
ncbi:MAG: U32 family peptidase [Nanoarchaeota archaeon]|nr:U32 family peptidase [Nanoarchaeota archaeon]